MYKSVTSRCRPLWRSQHFASKHRTGISASKCFIWFIFVFLDVNRSLSLPWKRLSLQNWNSRHFYISISYLVEWFHAWINRNYSPWPMSIAVLTFIVVADDFYRVRFTEFSLSVRIDSNWKIEWVVVDVPMALFPTCLQTCTKLDDDCIEKTLRW